MKIKTISILLLITLINNIYVESFSNTHHINKKSINHATFTRTLVNSKTTPQYGQWNKQIFLESTRLADGTIRKSKIRNALLAVKDQLSALKSKKIQQLSQKKKKVAISSMLLFLLSFFTKFTKAALASTAISPTRTLLAPLSSFLPNKNLPIKQIIKLTTILSLTLYLSYDMYTTNKRQRKDPTSEWSRYANNPLARGKAFNILLLQVLPLAILSHITSKHKLREISGKILTTGLLKLGPLYIKIGQILSCRKELLYKEWITSLQTLQDNVPAKSGYEATLLAHESFGSQSHFKNTLSYFDDVPLAAASLGQVHKAVLRDTNESVAIKIQRSKLRELYDKDLKLMKLIATTADTIVSAVSKKDEDSSSIKQNYTEIFLDAETILYREINYTMEAENTIQFANDFGIGYGGASIDTDGLPSAASWLRVPYIHKEYSTEKVLVMEYVPSIKINNQTELVEKYNLTDSQLEYISTCLARSYLRQFCHNHFFSTDPHHGNLGIEFMEDNQPRLVFYDFGQACQLSEEQGDGILKVIEGIMDMDAKSCVKAFLKMGVLVPDADLDVVQRKVQNNFDTGLIKVKGKKANHSIQTTNSTSEVKDKEVMKYFTLPAEYAFVARAITQMDGVGKGLDPDFDFISACAPYIVEIKGADTYVKDSIRKKFILPVLDAQSNIFKSLGFRSFVTEDDGGDVYL